mmetsp:Transcript_1661/g.1737  ORF Transcript_1661/g.1737 Transcript_1661/m.1737 type:complete len:433 (-) Transcript_1661:213-1511(-)
MGARCVLPLRKSLSEDSIIRSNLDICSENAPKIEELFKAAVDGSSSTLAFRCICAYSSGISSMTDFLLNNYNARVIFTLKLFEEYAVVFETSVEALGGNQSSVISHILEHQLRKMCRSIGISVAQFYPLENLVMETFPIYLGSESFHAWRLLEAQKRHTCLIKAKSQILKSTYPEIFTTRSVKKKLISANASTYSNTNNLDVVSPSKVKRIEIVDETISFYQPMRHENLPQSFPQADLMTCNEAQEMQSIINKCDDLAVKDFVEEDSWLLEFIIAVEHLPIAISIFLEANNHGKYPCVYANKAHEKAVKVSRERLIGQHVGRLDKFLGTNKFLSSLGDAISRMGSTIAIVDCTDRRHIVGLRPVMDDDHSCRYIVCLHEPCSENTIHACKKMDDFLTLIPKDLVCRKEKTGWLAKWERPLIPLENDERNFRL